MSEHAQPIPEAGGASVDPQSVEGVFITALGKASPAEREAFLDEACGDDAEMRRRVEALLRAYDDAGSFLESPAAGAHSPEQVDEVRLDFLSPLDKPDRIGALGPYEIIEVIGRGGMGIVLRGFDPKLNRVVAIKVLAPELATNPNARRRFAREAQAAASISHPHIVTIHAVDDGSESATGDSTPHLPYLVMECVSGQSLQEKLDRDGALRLTEILRIGKQIAEGLAAAHRQGLIHRDIKPANVLLENGVERVKITDFGLARAVDDMAITKTGEVTGTPQYMSPEQAKGERVDHRSDLFSLGCVLYAMCSGRPPFRADSMAGVINRVINDEPRPLAEVNPEIPAWTIGIIEGLLNKNADERFQSADEVAALLGDHLAMVQGRPTASHPTAPARTRVASTSRDAESHHVPPEWIAPVVGGAAAFPLTFALFRAFTLPDQLATAITILVGLLLAVRLLHLHSRNRLRTPEISAVSLLVLLAGIFCGGMAGARDGWNLLSTFSIDAVAIPAIAFGCLLLAWAYRLRKQSASTDPQSLQTESGRTASRGVRRRWVIGAISCVVLFAAALIGWAIYEQMGRGTLVLQHGRGIDIEEVHIDGRRASLVSNVNDTEVPSVPWGMHRVHVTFTTDDGRTRTVTTQVHLRRGQQKAIPIELMDEPTPAKNNRGSTWDESLATARVAFEVKATAVGVALHRQGTSYDPAEAVKSGYLRIRADDQLIFHALSSSKYAVPPGVYDVYLHDRGFGWLLSDSLTGGFNPGEAMFGMDSYSSAPAVVRKIGTVTASDGETARIAIDRDWQRIAENHPDWEDNRAAYEFLWNRRVYSLNKPQAKVVRRLIEALADGEPAVSIAKLAFMLRDDPDTKVVQQAARAFELADGGMDGGGGDGIRLLFDRGTHDAWDDLIVPAEDPATYRLAEPDHAEPHFPQPTPAPYFEGEADGMEDQGAQPETAVNPYGRNAVGSGPVPSDLDIGPTLEVQTERVEGSGRPSEVLVTVDTRDFGLLVVLRRVSEFSGEVVGEEEIFDTLGPTSRKLPIGRYQVLLRDLQFGWDHDRIESVQVPSGIKPRLIVERDHKNYVLPRPVIIEPFGYDTFRWNGETYRVNQAQVVCVNRLLRGIAERSPTVSSDELMQDLVTTGLATEAVDDSSTYVRNILSGSSEVDPFRPPVDLLNELVVTGTDSETYRLVPAEIAEVYVTIAHSLLAVVLKSRDGAIEEGFFKASGERMGIPPGEYVVTLHDHSVNWHYWDRQDNPRQQITSHEELPPFQLAAGEQRRISFARDAQHFHWVANYEVPEPHPLLYFDWFGRQTDRGRGRAANYPLDPEQAACLRVLLHALADGRPEMTGEQIVQAAGVEETFHEVFDNHADRFHSNGEVSAGQEKPKPPFEPWPNVIVRGAAEGTWRLSAPPEEEASLDPAAEPPRLNDAAGSEPEVIEQPSAAR